MTVDLRTCVPGQLLKDGRGNILEYKERIQVDQSSLDGLRYRHLLWYEIAKYDETFTDDGIFDINCSMSNWNIVEILPLAKPEQPKSDKHPSVVWWESCPWSTDRKPTEEDGDHLGQVIQQVPWTMVTPCSWGISETKTTLCFSSWAYVKEGQDWIHSLNWSPVKQTPKEKALALIAKHKDSSTVGVWVPTPDDWDIIREGLTE